MQTFSCRALDHEQVPCNLPECLKRHVEQCNRTASHSCHTLRPRAAFQAQTQSTKASYTKKKHNICTSPSNAAQPTKQKQVITYEAEDTGPSSRQLQSYKTLFFSLKCLLTSKKEGFSMVPCSPTVPLPQLSEFHVIDAQTQRNIEGSMEWKTPGDGLCSG